MTEATVNGVHPDEIAKRRAGRILLNDPPPVENRRSNSPDSMIEGFIVGMGQYPVKECVVRSVFTTHGNLPDWKEFARLKSVFVLKMTGTVENVLELLIGTTRNQRVKIAFRGRRGRRYSNTAPAIIEIEGTCPLG